jgi:hypothetical protein
MARMYPNRLRPDTKSEAEKKLYRLFEAQLPDDFHVFHSVAWQLPGMRREARDGEADFIIAHPKLGLCVLEVKGGLIRYDGQTAQWYSGDYVIKDPFEQAKTNKYSLLNLLQSNSFWKERNLNIGHAVAFPDVTVTSALRLDASREIVMDAGDLTDLGAWCRRVLAYWHGESSQLIPPGDNGLRVLIELLSPSWDLRLRLGSAIRNEQVEIEQLTTQQYAILDLLGRTRRAAICGCAGSGKTTLAVEKAVRLARQGAHVLFTCYNRFLGDLWAENLKEIARVDVSSFQKLAYDRCKRANLAFDRSHGDEDFLSYTLPELLMQAVEKLGARYDAVVVDEGQDFRENWWVPLQCLLQDSVSDFFYVFFDDNQNLYRTAEVPNDLPTFQLTHNLRNTRLIHQVVMQFYRSDLMPEATGPIGRPVEEYTYSNSAELKAQLRGTLHRLIEKESVTPEDIVVLTPRSNQHSALWRLGQLGNYRLTDEWAAGGAEIYCSTIHSFKGLESPVVILAEVDSEVNGTAALMYVGGSRAMNHLIVLKAAGSTNSVSS